MTLTCRSFTATPISTGEIRLVIPDATPDAAEGRMTLQQVAALLCKSIKAIDKLSRRKKNPLPVYRGNGRPYAFRHEVNAWLTRPPPFRPLRSVFGSPP